MTQTTTEELLTQEELDALDKRVSANVDTLISIGRQDWYRTRRKGKKLKTKQQQEDQLREIEDSLVEDKHD